MHREGVGREGSQATQRMTPWPGCGQWLWRVPLSRGCSITGPLSAMQAGSSQQEGLVASHLSDVPSLGSSSLEGLVNAFIVRDSRIHPRLESEVSLQKPKLFLLGSGGCAKPWVSPETGGGNGAGGHLEHVQGSHLDADFPEEFSFLEFVPEGWLQNGLGDPSGGFRLGDLGLSSGSQFPLVSGFFLLLLLLQEAEGLEGREEHFLPLLDPRLPLGLVALHDLLVEGQVDMRGHRLCPELPVALCLLLALPLGLLPLTLEGGR